MFRRHGFEKRGVILPGEGVVVAAQFFDCLGIVPGRHRRRALEQKMFQIVRHAGTPRRFIRGPHLVPDHVRDDGNAVVGDHHDLQAVLQDKTLRPEGAGLRRCPPKNG
jgi:hypothetical protein